VLKVEMHFLPDIYVQCDVCRGRRYNRETLDIQYRGRNIHEILQMTVGQAAEFFAAVPVIVRKLQTMVDVGLAYITLGQSATTLSGGEAQRVKLALELSKRDTGRTLYILDEPTTGLHFHDIDLLLRVLHRLRDHGNTVVVIEHNLDVIKTADWIIDLGPEGGDAGGKVIAEGTPEDIAKNMASHTGRYLNEHRINA
jgi:excinuclease ABC subunit A